VSVAPAAYAPAVRYDVVVVGGGTAGCVLAAHLSEDPERRVCLLEAGPDYGSRDSGRWPPELLDARAVPSTHLWEPGSSDGRTLGGRVVGGSSSVNACMILAGTPGDYDEWGGPWSYASMADELERARRAFRTTSRSIEEAGPFHQAFVEAGVALGFESLDDFDDPQRPVGVGAYPANVVDGGRWSAAAAYLDPCRSRANLEVVPESVVDRVLVEHGRAVGVVDAAGREVGADAVVLCAGAYFTPAILLRSGIGPRDELERLGLPTIADLPVGEGLADHCGATVAWSASATLRADSEVRASEARLSAACALLKAASSTCPAGAWDLHLVPWLARGEEPGSWEAAVMVFHMKPASRRRVSLRSTDPAETPNVERGFLSSPPDLAVILEGIELARRLGAQEPLRSLLGPELRPGQLAADEYVRASVRGYFHPVGTCAIGAVVDIDGRVLGVDGLVVADASVMPTIPRANTNLTTAAIAERIAMTMEG
jgi:choline dehydrogenase